MKIVNVFHIHDKICGHSTNEFDEVVAYALKAGYKKLVFTEHCPLTNNKLLIRPTFEQVESLRTKIDNFNKKQLSLKVEFGYEIEYQFENIEYFNLLKHDKNSDFLIFGNHFYGDMWKKASFTINDSKTRNDLMLYYKQSELALKTKMFSWFAHPDIWINSYGKWDKNAIWLTNKLIKLALKYDIPFGFNANGMHSKRDGLHYPSKYFWNIVSKTPVKVLIEADAHDLETLSKEWLTKTHKEAVKYGLINNIIDDIKLKYLKK